MSGERMHADDAAVVPAYRLKLGNRRFRGRVGGRRGRHGGSSLEFLDFRDYVPGDDLRHVDWRSYARTEQLRVRMHEEEVAPFVDVVVDASASMAVTEGKQRALHAMVGALLRWARHEGASVRVLTLGGGLVDAQALRCDGETGPVPPAVPLRAGGARVLVTDGLWQADPSPLVHTLLGGGTAAVVLQLLDPWERAPTVGGALTLVDCEHDARAELRLDATAIATYQERLQRLCDGLRTRVVAGGGLFAAVTADSLAAMCARDLLPAGVVEPA
jgi:hypothetical protein